VKIAGDRGVEIRSAPRDFSDREGELGVRELPACGKAFVGRHLLVQHRNSPKTSRLLRKQLPAMMRKSLILMVPQEGFEPQTPSLRIWWPCVPRSFQSFLIVAKSS
jgi:hypothetical protein